MKIIITIMFSCSFLLFSTKAFSVPEVTGEPVVLQHLGKILWPQDTPMIAPSLTQTNSSDINDLHGDLDCDFIISTAGNYHFALLEAMQGRPDLSFDGLQAILADPTSYGLSFGALKVCWSTSPPISVDQTMSNKLQFKNIIMHGRPALAMGPGGVMNTLADQGSITDTRPASTPGTAFLRNKGNVILLRANKTNKIKDICDLGKSGIRVVTPNNTSEPGSFGNFSGTIFNVADQNNFGCDATALFNSIFSQDITDFDLEPFNNPTDITGVWQVFYAGNASPKWVASSRIMHRDIPYALCYDMADAGVIFHHQATYLKATMATEMSCPLEIIPLPGTFEAPMGNRFGTLRVAKVLGHTDPDVLAAQDFVFDFLVNSTVWTQILIDNDLVDPSPNY